MGRKRKVVNLDEFMNKMRSPDGCYVPNSLLLEEWKKSHELGKPTEVLGIMFMSIATKLSHAVKYKYDEDREDCISRAVMDCLLYWDRFNPDKSETPNPFAYFTELCKNGLAKGWNELGYMDLPFSKRLSVSDNIYSI